MVLEGGHAALFQAAGSLRSNGEVRVDVMPEGTVYVSNIGKDKTSVVCGEETVEMAPGETNVMQAAV